MPYLLSRPYKLSQHRPLTSAACNSALLWSLFQPKSFQCECSRYFCRVCKIKISVVMSFFDINEYRPFFVNKKLSRTEKVMVVGSRVSQSEGNSPRLHRSMSRRSCSPCRLVETSWFNDARWNKEGASFRFVTERASNLLTQNNHIKFCLEQHGTQVFCMAKHIWCQNSLCAGIFTIRSSFFRRHRKRKLVFTVLLAFCLK